VLDLLAAHREATIPITVEEAAPGTFRSTYNPHEVRAESTESERARERERESREREGKSERLRRRTAAGNGEQWSIGAQQAGAFTSTPGALPSRGVSGLAGRDVSCPRTQPSTPFVCLPPPCTY
jgi:hypothetical protein